MFNFSMMIVAMLAMLSCMVNEMAHGNIPMAFAFFGFGFGYAGLALYYAGS